MTIKTMKMKRLISNFLKGFLVLAAFTGISFFYFYRSPASPQMLRIPVSFYSFSSCPIIQAVIENQSYRLKIDLGSSYPMSLRQEVLAKIVDKTKLEGTAKYADIKGNVYHSPLYEMPPLQITEKLIANSCETIEEDLYCLTYGSTVTLSGAPTISKAKKKQLALLHGRLGLSFFDKNLWLFDFPHSCIYVPRNKHVLEPRLRNFIPVPFTRTPSGMILAIETDRGIKRLILDTGTTYSCLRKGAETAGCLRTQKFILGDVDYGPRSLFNIDITDKMHDCDGILGIDFLRKHAFYLDFDTSTAYFQPPRQTWF